MSLPAFMSMTTLEWSVLRNSLRARSLQPINNIFPEGNDLAIGLIERFERLIEEGVIEVTEAETS